VEKQNVCGKHSVGVQPKAKAARGGPAKAEPYETNRRTGEGLTKNCVDKKRKLCDTALAFVALVKTFRIDLRGCKFTLVAFFALATRGGTSIK
jgi:hypothetical protein